MRVGRTLVGSSSMRFQVVLQWPAHSLNDYDEMIAVEDYLIAKLSEQSEVDGHDFGKGETNIFCWIVCYRSAPSIDPAMLDAVAQISGVRQFFAESAMTIAHAIESFSST